MINKGKKKLLDGDNISLFKRMLHSPTLGNRVMEFSFEMPQLMATINLKYDLQLIFVWTINAKLEPYKVYRCNIFFSLRNTDDVDRVYIASIHLEERALEWIKVMKSPSHIVGGILSLKMLSISLIQVNMMML